MESLGGIFNKGMVNESHISYAANHTEKNKTSTDSSIGLLKH